MFNITCKEDLEKLKKIALRKGLWFKLLDRLERAAIDLTIKVVEKIRSIQLKSVLSRIASKIAEAIKARSIKAKALEIGRPLAHKIAQIAMKLGNKEAWKWAQDPGFIMYLGISWLNTSPIFRYPIS
ncbi:MAG: hypothetical protein ACXQTI_04330 [Candidatus Nezhaarchaeales archaeon]